MLGIHRPGVSIAVGALEVDGIIRPSRNSIQVRDREGLLKRSCECYAVVHAKLQQFRLAHSIGGRNRAGAAPRAWRPDRIVRRRRGAVAGGAAAAEAVSSSVGPTPDPPHPHPAEMALSIPVRFGHATSP